MALQVDPTITYFPVSNGDTSLIRLADGFSFLIDLNLTQESLDPDEDARYDVRTHLLGVLSRDNARRPHLNVFALSHGDQDHIRGIRSTFYLGDPANYGKTHADDDLVIIDELWFAPRIFHDGSDLSDEAKAFKKEARRRVELYRRNKQAAIQSGNRLRVIGGSGHEDLQGLEQITSVAGEVIDEFNGQVRDDFDVFVHGPFKRDSDGDDSDRNMTSMILQARFHLPGHPRALLAMLGGDANSAIWEKVVEYTRDETNLEWDLLLAPHHCSWTFFSEEPCAEGMPSEKVLDFLRFGRLGAKIVSSSKVVLDDDCNPPHYRAAELYRDIVGKKNFHVTMDDPDEPLQFRATAFGAQEVAVEVDKVAQAAIARQTALGVPKTYG